MGVSKPVRRIRTQGPLKRERGGNGKHSHHPPAHHALASLNGTHSARTNVLTIAILRRFE
jgi:hypothetical protein